jgi:carbamoyl-phosphate synthase large subunit
VVLVNSNPATIMTDPDLADRTYIEPLTPEFLDRVLAAEKPDAILPTVGGQTALNLALEAGRQGILAAPRRRADRRQPPAIEKAEDRDQFKAAMLKIGLDVPRSVYCHSLAEARAALEQIGFPAIIRASFTLGGSGAGGLVQPRRVRRQVEHALSESLRGEILVEESVLGWKEYELEVMRDARTTSSSSARSRTSTPWACTPATASPSPPRRRSPTRSTSACATPAARWSPRSA